MRTCATWVPQLHNTTWGQRCYFLISMCAQITVLPLRTMNLSVHETRAFWENQN